MFSVVIEDKSAVISPWLYSPDAWWMVYGKDYRGI